MARAPPSNLMYIGTKGAFRKTLLSVRQKLISQNRTKEGPFRWAGGRIPEGRDVEPPSAPLNPPLLILNLAKPSLQHKIDAYLK